MGVQSYLELSTLLMGWYYYGQLWELLTSTGLVFLPYVMLVVKNFFEPIRNYQSEGASDHSLRRMLLDMLSVTLFYLFCAIPMHTITPHTLTYTPTCSDKPTVIAGQTGTTYDTVFNLPQEVKLPTFWYFVLSVSNGITYAAKHTIDCPTDLRGMNIELQGAIIEDSQLRQDVQDFTAQCYKPSWAKYLREQPQTNVEPDDMQWLGSQFFLETPGYYDTFKALQAVQGFPYDKETDWELGEDALWGAPLCKDWWQDNPHGLYQQLSELLPDSWYLEKDTAIKQLINTTSTAYVNDPYLSHQRDNHNILTKTAGVVGTLISSMSFYPKMHLLKQSLPIIQSTILFLIYIILPFAHVYGGYRFQSTFVLAFLVFGIIFWSFLWELASILDNTIIGAWFEDGTMMSKANIYYLLANMIAALAYVGFPLIWVIIMGIVGKRTLGVMALVHQGSEPAASAGASGASALTSLGKAGISSGASLVNQAWTNYQAGKGQGGSGNKDTH